MFSYTEFIIISFFFSIVYSKSVGKSCILPDKVSRGVCKLTSDCPQVIEDYQNGIQPILCDNTSSEAIVCCGNISDDPVLIVNRYNELSSQTKRISEMKCEEYSKLGVATTAFISLEIDPSIQNVDIPVCEFVYSTGLIVGGQATKAGEFPHMAAIGWIEDNIISYDCAGSLISSRFVLTAGHCSAAHGEKPDIAVLGALNLYENVDGVTPQIFKVKQIFIHPSYKRTSNYNDIAIIKLDRDVTFDKYVRPACLWPANDINMTTTVATGWGAVEYSGSKSNVLLKVPLGIVNNTFCGTIYDKSKKLKQGIIDSQICAGGKVGQDTCQGDSGGPIQVKMPNQKCIFHILGITSFGKACGAANGFGVYTRVSSYLDWIESIVWK